MARRAQAVTGGAVTQGAIVPERRRTTNITMTERTSELLAVYAIRRRVPIGRIVEQWILPHLRGMRLPTMPTDLILDSPETPIPAPEESQGTVVNDAVETLPMTETVTPTVEPVKSSDAKRGGEKPPRLQAIVDKGKRA